MTDVIMTDRSSETANNAASITHKSEPITVTPSWGNDKWSDPDSTTPSMSDTPETDGAIGAAGQGPNGMAFAYLADFARRLERERNEARREAERWRGLVPEQERRFAEARRRIEGLMNQTNIPLSAATIWCEAIAECLKVMDEVSKQKAGDCTKCGGPVMHRPGKPGEYDHECTSEPNAEVSDRHE